MGCGASATVGDEAVEPEPVEEVDELALVLQQIQAARVSLTAQQEEHTAVSGEWRFCQTVQVKVAAHTNMVRADLVDATDLYNKIATRIAELDADELKESASGMGTDEAKMAHVILGRMTISVQLTDVVYQQRYGKSLADEVRGENHTLAGMLTGSLTDFGRFLSYRTMKADDRDAFLLNKAMSGTGCNDKVLIEILSTRTNAELEAAAACYEREYGKSLKNTIMGETGGFGKKWYGKWIDQVVQFNRDETAALNDPEGVADILYKAGEGKWTGTDEQPFIDHLVNANPVQIAAISEAYEAHEKSSKTLLEAIESEFGGDIEYAVLARLRPPTQFFAHRVYKAAKGWGTDEECLARVLACLEKKEVRELAAFYDEEFKGESDDNLRTLRGMLLSELSGDFLDALLYYIESDPPVGHCHDLDTYSSLAAHSANEFTAATVAGYCPTTARAMGMTNMNGPLVLPNAPEVFLSPGRAEIPIAVQLPAVVPGDISEFIGGDDPSDVDDAKALLGSIQAKEQEVVAGIVTLQTFVERFKGSTYAKLLYQLRHNDFVYVKTTDDNEASLAFSAARDARLINEAVEGWGTDEDKLIATMCCLPKVQLSRVSAIYETAYGKTLERVMDEELGGIFEGNLKYFMTVLLADRATFDAKLLTKAMKGWGTSDALLCEVIGTRSNAELHAAKKAFSEMNGGASVESWVEGDTWGSYQAFLLDCLKAERSEGPADLELATKQANQLVEALGNWGVGADQDVTRQILTGASEEHMQAIREAFDGDLAEKIKWACTGDWERCLLTRVYTRAQYQVIRLHAAFDQWGTDDAMTCRILGRNSKAMLQKVSEEYEKMYSKSLEQAIKSECSGKYKKALLQSLFNTSPGQDED